jgi:opacity protein-like surface antigen
LFLCGQKSDLLLKWLRKKHIIDKDVVMIFVKQYCLILFATTSVAISPFVLASNATSTNQNKQTTFIPSFLQSLPYSWVATLSAGPTWENAGSAQTMYLTPAIEKTYTTNRTTHTVGDLELFAGIQTPLREKLNGQFGLAAATTSNATLTGNIWDDADPAFNNYTYSYHVSHTSIALKGKLLADMGYIVIPWISGSLGVGFNYASGFTNTPTLSEALVMPNFKSQTTAAFTYTLGTGIQVKLDPHWQVGVGYEFADWGNSQLSRAPSQTQSSGLSLSHLYTNGVLFNLTYNG